MCEIWIFLLRRQNEHRIGKYDSDANVDANDARPNIHYDSGSTPCDTCGSV